MSVTQIDQCELRFLPPEYRCQQLWLILNREDFQAQFVERFPNITLNVQIAAEYLEEKDMIERHLRIAALEIQESQHVLRGVIERDALDLESLNTPHIVCEILGERLNLNNIIEVLAYMDSVIKETGFGGRILGFENEQGKQSSIPLKGGTYYPFGIWFPAE